VKRTAADIIGFISLSVLFLVGCWLSLFYGGSERIVSGVGHLDFIFREIRIPKTITAVIAGCTLSVSGLVLQIVFRNPLAGPYVLGISSGAALMVAIGVMAGGAFIVPDILQGKALLVLLAMTGSFFVTLLILYISKKVNSNVVLLLIGLMFSQICGAIQTSLEYFAEPADLKSFVLWGMGSVSNTTMEDLRIFFPAAVVLTALLFLFIKPLNALLLGQAYAQNSGVDFQRNRFFLILISSLLTGLTTAFCGPVAFVGVAVPILSRMIFKSSHQQVHLVSCALAGSTILLFADAISHSTVSNIVLPVNMITTFIGAPLVIYLMFRNKQW
jgi:iron complex transport system permease protein